MCRTFFGHPYTAPGTVPKRFFMLHVMPAQWCVLSFGIEMMKSDCSSSTGNASSRRPVNQLLSGTIRTSS